MPTTARGRSIQTRGEHMATFSALFTTKCEYQCTGRTYEDMFNAHSALVIIFKLLRHQCGLYALDARLFHAAAKLAKSGLHRIRIIHSVVRPCHSSKHETSPPSPWKRVRGYVHLPQPMTHRGLKAPVISRNRLQRSSPDYNGLIVRLHPFYATSASAE